MDNGSTIKKATEHQASMAWPNKHVWNHSASPTMPFPNRLTEGTTTSTKKNSSRDKWRRRPTPGGPPSSSVRRPLRTSSIIASNTSWGMPSNLRHGCSRPQCTWLKPSVHCEAGRTRVAHKVFMPNCWNLAAARWNNNCAALLFTSLLDSPEPRPLCF